MQEEHITRNRRVDRLQIYSLCWSGVWKWKSISYHWIRCRLCLNNKVLLQKSIKGKLEFFRGESQSFGGISCSVSDSIS